MLLFVALATIIGWAPRVAFRLPAWAVLAVVGSCGFIFAAGPRARLTRRG